MLREMDLETQTDGRRYGINDMAKLGCNDCSGCSDCCSSVEDTIILDPYDMYRLEAGAGISVNELMNSYLELGVVDGVILPHIKMDSQTHACRFLNSEGRCSIHPYRTGFCRLYPLGRLYENGDFSYVLMTDQCDRARTKVKISKWIDTPQPDKYHSFILRWHDFLKEFQNRFMENPDAESMKPVVMQILNVFYLQQYGSETDFYEQIEARFAAFD